MNDIDDRRRAAIGRLLRPRSVAIVGASPTPGSLGGAVLGNLERFGFKGDIHLVNPSRSEINGRACVATTRDLPHGVDAVVLAIPQKGVIDALKGCAERGVGGAIVFSAGFAEAGPEGVARQAELAAIARDAGMAIEGPNCLGLVNYIDGVAMTFGVALPFPPAGGKGVAIISQSGAMATVVRAALHARDIGLSVTVSTGNEAVDGVEDFLDALIDDPSSAVIAMVVEQFRKPAQFVRLARRARAMGKPIFLMHPGRGQAARQSAATHTGAIAGDWDLMRARVEGEGVCVVESLEELIDLSEIALRSPRMPSGGVAMITDSGAFKAMTLDTCELLGLATPPLSSASADVIGAIAPGLILPTNPLDLTAQALVDPDLYRKTLRPLIDDPAFGSIVFGVIFSSPLIAHRKNKPIIDALREFKPEKPVYLAMLGDEAEVPADLIADFRSLGVPFFRSPERLMRALARLDHWASRPLLPAEAKAPAPHERLPAGTIPEYRAKALLSHFGLRAPMGGMATSLKEAREIAARIGYPVALKAQSADLSHKSDAGGVVLGLASETALHDGWTRLHGNVALAMPDLVLDGVLVEAMSPRGVELIVGAKNDPDWGPVLLVGLGGVFAEALKDVRILPAGLSAETIATEIGKLKGAALLKGFRGDRPRDISAAAELAASVGRFILAHPEVAEIDINPVLVLPEGEGALALDALIHVA
jgi:acyl-CoA synthetase (NDP forming)